MYGLSNGETTRALVALMSDVYVKEKLEDNARSRIQEMYFNRTVAPAVSMQRFEEDIKNVVRAMQRDKTPYAKMLPRDIGAIRFNELANSIIVAVDSEDVERRVLEALG